MFKLLILALIPLFIILHSLFFFAAPVSAQVQNQKYSVIINPIRGTDFWSHSHDLLSTPRKQYEVISKNNQPATWLIRYDALKNQEAVNFLKGFNSSQEVGLFLEITPSLTQDSGVRYNETGNWHFVQSVLLVGYSSEDRIKMIDQSVKKYKEIFGKDPKSVGAWWIDAYSLNYLREKYGVIANLDVTDQYSTDGYQVWGQYWSVPFYPSKNNALIPAQSEQQKIGVVTMQWATRDPYNAYGSGVHDSTYSVQANDYMLHDLGIEYFEKLLDIYPQTTVGLENDFSWEQFGEEFTKQLNVLAQRSKQGRIIQRTMEGYAQNYISANPKLSPTVIINATDPLGGSGRVVWFQNTRYRAGWFYGPYGSVIRDLRMYNDSEKEPCFDKACRELNLAITSSKPLDEVSFRTKWVIDEGKISDFKLNQTADSAEITYKNQASDERKIKFLINDVQIDEKIQPVSFAILNALNIPTSEGKEGVTNTSFHGDNLLRITIGFIKFIVLTLFFFYIPGFVLSRNKLAAIPVGWALFTLLSYLLGYLRLDLSIWILPIISGIFYVKSKHYRHLIPADLKKYLWLVIILLIGSGCWMITSVKNGLNYAYGLGFWGPSGHDGIWHLSLSSELQRNFPPQNAIFAGEALHNYHYFFNLLVARSGSLLGIDNQDLLFRFFPLLFALLLGVLVARLTYHLAIKSAKLTEKQSMVATAFALFFVYFGGSFGWIVSYLRDRTFSGESMFWSMQSISTLLNPPFAISLVLLFTGLVLFITKEELHTSPIKKLWKKEFLYLLSLLLVWGTLIEFKAYAGVLLLVGLGLIALERLILTRSITVLVIFLGCLIISLLVFLPNNSASTSLFVFAPFWFITSMLQFQDRLFLPRLNLTIESGVFYKVIGGYAVGFVLFLVGNFGTRIISKIAIKELLKNRLFLYMILLGITIPTFFIQKGTNWNSIQFIYYSLMLTNIFAGIAIGIMYRRFKKIAVITGILLVLFTLPTTFNTIFEYSSSIPPAYLSTAELEGLNVLKKQPAGIVMTLPAPPTPVNREAGLPLVSYTSTAYVSAFSNHPVFIEDMMNLDILGIDYKARINLQRDFSKDRNRARNILKENNIAYIYVLKSQNFEDDEQRMGIQKIFENDEVRIFKVL